MGYVTREQIAKAKEMDLLTYLENYDRGELVHVGGRTYSTKTHDSLKISHGKWMWWSRGIGGRSALDYLIKVKGCRFTDAVEMLTEDMNRSPPESRLMQQEQAQSASLVLPERNTDAQIVKAYLTGRGIDEEIVDKCLNRGLIYESKQYHNAVFVGFDENGESKYASFRAANGKRIMGDAGGSDKRFSFRLVNGGSDCVHVFESAIDLLSFATLAKIDGKDYMKTNLLSVSGIHDRRGDGEYVLPAALKYFLENNRKIRHICIRFDNDRAGMAAAQGIKNRLKNSYGIYIVPPEKGKDYNDFLKMRKGILKEKFMEREENFNGKR